MAKAKKESAIVIKDLHKSYGSFEALKGISFDVKKGEFFGFLGPNGAGKTTTINILTGLTNRNSGDVTVFGKDVRDDYREARKLIGISPQEFNFDVFMDTAEILDYAAGYFGIPKAERKKRVDELLKAFDLESKRDTGYRKLSGGMKRRLALARALIHKPKIIILDEPTAGVDIELRKALWEYLKKLKKEGVTIFLTTHYLEEAEMLCDRIAIIHKGEIVRIDTKQNMIKDEKLEEVYIKLTNEGNGNGGKWETG